MLNLFKVSGNSMGPDLVSGDYVISTKVYFKIEKGDTLVVKHPLFGLIIKKVFDVCGQLFLLIGENHQESVTTKQMGWIGSQQIKGKVVLKVKARAKL